MFYHSDRKLTRAQCYFEIVLHYVSQAVLGHLTLSQPSEFGKTSVHDQVQLQQFLMLTSLRNGILVDTNFCFDDLCILTFLHQVCFLLVHPNCIK